MIFYREYLNNIVIVDDGIQEVVGLLEEFYYYDNRIVYIVIVDYGMIDWGLYGVGYFLEIFILLVVWGVGIRYLRGVDYNI